MFKYHPNEGRILLRKLRKPNYIRVSSGIVVPGEGIMNRELDRGLVIEGTEKIKKGQIVWYSSYSASTLYDKDLGTFYCLAEEDVMVFEDGKASPEEIIDRMGKGTEVKSKSIFHPQTDDSQADRNFIKEN